jgi:hypothetical protein
MENQEGAVTVYLRHYTLIFLQRLRKIRIKISELLAEIQIRYEAGVKVTQLHCLVGTEFNNLRVFCGTFLVRHVIR